MRSVLAVQLAEFLEEKRSAGCRYKREAWALRAFDKYLCDIGHPTQTLPKEVVEGWVLGRPHQCPKTHVTGHSDPGDLRPGDRAPEIS
jgi:hypothetical protein